MRIRHELFYEAPPGEVYAMLVDPAFRDAVCDALGVLRREVTIGTTDRGADVRIAMTQRTKGLPGFATRIVGTESEVVQTESWRAREGADLQVEITGKPGRVHGRITLSAAGRGTLESFEGEATIKVPFVGGRLEGLIERLFIEGMETERGVGAHWLAGDRR